MTGVTDAFQAKARERTDWRKKRAEEERKFEEELVELRGHIKLEAAEWSAGVSFADSLTAKSKQYTKALEDRGTGNWQSGSDLWEKGGLRAALRMQVCSKTQVLIPRGTAGLNGDITVGSFGFGTRYNKNSQPFDSLRSFKQLFDNREAIVKKLEELRLKKTKKMFEEVCAVAGDVEVWSEGQATIPLPTSLPVELTEGSYVFRGIQFSNQGVALMPEKGSHGITLVNSWRFGQAENRLAEPDVYVAFRALEPYFKDVLAGADAAIARASAYSRKDVVQKLQEATGRYLLLESL